MKALTRIGMLPYLNWGGAAYSYLYDGKGNVTGLLDGVGIVPQTYQYDPFGAPKGASGSVSQPMQFSTKTYDDQTGLSYYGYRFYVPSLGRWLTRDPIGEKGGINLYGFVGNNPISWIDPWGLHGSMCYTDNPNNPRFPDNPDATKVGANDLATRIEDAIAWYMVYPYIWTVNKAAGQKPPPIWPPISLPPPQQLPGSDPNCGCPE